MFESFVYFNEVIKLSTIIFYRLQRVNFCETALKKSLDRRYNLNYANQLVNLIVEDNIDIKIKNDLDLLYPAYLSSEERKKLINCHAKLFIHNKMKFPRFPSDSLDSEVIIFLVDNSSSIEKCPLDKALYDCKLRVIKFLVENGNNQHLLDSNVLATAIKSRKWKIVDYLISKKAIVDVNNTQLLLSVVERRKYKVAEYLIENGVGVDTLPHDQFMLIYQKVFLEKS